MKIKTALIYLNFSSEKSEDSTIRIKFEDNLIEFPISDQAKSVLESISEEEIKKFLEKITNNN